MTTPSSEKKETCTKHSDQHFRNIFMQAGVGIAEVSTEGIFLRVNNSFCNITGYSSQELSVMSFAQLTHLDDLEASWKNINALLSGKATVYSMEKRYRHKNGSIIWANLTVSLVTESTENTKYFVAILVDITKQKRIEQQLKKLSQAIEQSPASVVITDTAGVIEYVNPIFTTVTGYQREEVVGHNPRILKSGNLPHDFYKNMWQTILKGEIWRGEFINRRKNGESYWENASISPIFNISGEITHLVAVKEDITLRKEMETKLINARQVAEEANKAKSVFLANMSHEIRTPLNAILGFAQILHKDDTLSAAQKEKVSIINKSGEHLLSLINNILEGSKTEAGRITLNLVPFDLTVLFQDVKNLFSLTVLEKGISLAVIIDPEVPHCIIADAGKLKQILINLINNAIKFTDHGKIEVLVSSERVDTERFLLHVAVHDTGCGIAQENLTKIFNYFEQGVLHNKGGTGIGLSLTKSFIEFMKGTISVSSQLGQGSTFSFTLPVLLTEDKQCLYTSQQDSERAAISQTEEQNTPDLVQAEEFFHTLPTAVKDQLRMAATNGDLELLEQYSEKISHEAPIPSQFLNKLLTGFEFEKLTKLFT